MKKKLLIGLTIIIIALAIFGMIYIGIVNTKNEKNLDKHLIEIKFSELQEKVNNKETFILVLTQTDCSHCAEYKPTFKKVLAEYDVYAYELNIAEDKITQEEKNQLKNIANTSGTPTTIFIKDGEEVSTATRLVGNKPTSDIIKRLKAMGYIKE
ncbi:MAG: thioredoxin family protein [Bacilli bacterium]|nr:thioredoxin family protein [Bacilli bacterium]